MEPTRSGSLGLRRPKANRTARSPYELRILNPLSAAKKLETLLPVAAVLGAISYAALRTVYAQFYDHFGVSPEQAGHDQTAVLTQALVGPIVVAVLSGLLWGVPMYLLMTPFGIMQAARPLLKGVPARRWWERLRRRAFWVDAKRFARRSIGVWFLAGTLWGTFMTAYLLYTEAGNLGTQVVTEGRIVAEGLTVFAPGVRALDLEARPVTISTLDPAKRVPAEMADPTCLLYLGRQGDYGTFYDVRQRRSFQLKVSDLVLRLDSTAEYLPSVCSAPT